MSSPPRDDLIRSSFANNSGGARAVQVDPTAGGIGTLSGHASVFNVQYEVCSAFEGNFLERIAPGAFSKSVRERGPSGNNSIKVLFEHGYDAVTGNRPLGPLAELREDNTGLFYEVPLLDTSYNRDLLPGLKAGLYGASFRFKVTREDWSAQKPSDSNPRGLELRTIKELALAELGPVTFPASQAATAGVRSAEAFRKWAGNQAAPRKADSFGPNRRRRAVELLKIWS